MSNLPRSSRIESYTVEPRYNEPAGDRPNLFVMSRVRYIENLDITNFTRNDQNVRCIEVIVNDWFVTQTTSVTHFNAIDVAKKCRVLRCDSLSTVAFRSNYFHFWAEAQLLTKNDTFIVAISKCCNMDVIQKIVYVNKETGFSVFMLHYPTFPELKDLIFFF